ncbi:hypothetical protein [Escherichia coli]|uniref:F4 family fimbrial subunit n=1 Tax=Escherichia coli TaxID=562 RepID=UPI0005A8D2DC|nr:hypothetical protein [Escherichia coli]
MKKTLIALAVAASAAVSGSAIAGDWVEGGSGGRVDFGGTLSPQASSGNPWEVKIGDAVNNLDATVDKSGVSAVVSLTQDISILSLRDSGVFSGRAGIAPQINYNGTVAINSFENGYAPLTLDVNDSNGNKIGTATTSVFVIAQASNKATTIKDSGINSMYASAPGYAFFGGIGTASTAIASYGSGASFAFVADASANYSEQGLPVATGKGQGPLATTTSSYSAFYASGIEKSKTIEISLENPVTGSVSWKASLPIVVTYA